MLAYVKVAWELCMYYGKGSTPKSVRMTLSITTSEFKDKRDSSVIYSGIRE